MELKTALTFITNFVDEQNEEALNDDKEGKQIIEKYYKKTMRTVEVLMNQLNMMYFLERIKLALAGEEIDLDVLIKLMGRCLKLYDMIH